MISFTLFFLLILFFGFLVGFPKSERYVIPKTILFVIVEALIAMVLFIISWAIIALLERFEYMWFKGVGSLFLTVLLVSIANGIVLYWIQELWLRKFCTPTMFMLSEYVIQWTLIYVTVYQVVFDNIIEEFGKQRLQLAMLFTPTDITIIVLPSLFSVWVAVVLHRTKRHFEQHTISQ